jgi:hypothetical protein
MISMDAAEKEQKASKKPSTEITRVCGLSAVASAKRSYNGFQ